MFLQNSISAAQRRFESQQHIFNKKCPIILTEELWIYLYLNGLIQIHISILDNIEKTYPI